MPARRPLWLRHAVARPWRWSPVHSNRLANSRAIRPSAASRKARWFAKWMRWAASSRARRIWPWCNSACSTAGRDRQCGRPVRSAIADCIAALCVHCLKRSRCSPRCRGWWHACCLTRRVRACVVWRRSKGDGSAHARSCSRPAPLAEASCTSGRGRRLVADGPVKRRQRCLANNSMRWDWRRPVSRRAHRRALTVAPLRSPHSMSNTVRLSRSTSSGRTSGPRVDATGTRRGTRCRCRAGLHGLRTMAKRSLPNICTSPRCMVGRSRHVVRGIARVLRTKW